MLGCSSLLLTEIAFLIHYSSFKSLLATCYPLDFTSLYLFCLSFFFTSLMKESTITDRPLVLTPPALCFLRLRSRATLFFFFFLHLIPAHTFLILILQVASYKTHIKCQLTLITGRCGVLRSTRVLHTMLNRPGTRSNRLGPDPDPADHLKYRPEPERVPGRVPGPRVSGPLWRPLVWMMRARLHKFTEWIGEIISIIFSAIINNLNSALHLTQTYCILPKRTAPENTWRFVRFKCWYQSKLYVLASLKFIKMYVLCM